MTEKEFQIRKKILDRKLKERKMKVELRKLKWSWLPRIKKPTASKLIVLVTFAICLQILWFSEHMVSVTGDTSYMYVLLGVPVSLIPVTLGYLNKSRIQNSSGGITYEIAMEELKHKYELENTDSVPDELSDLYDDYEDMPIGESEDSVG